MKVMQKMVMAAGVISFCFLGGQAMAGNTNMGRSGANNCLSANQHGICTMQMARNGSGHGNGHRYGPGDGTGNGGNGPKDGSGYGSGTGVCPNIHQNSTNNIHVAGNGNGHRGHGPGDGTGNGGNGPKDGSGFGNKTGDCSFVS